MTNPNTGEEIWPKRTRVWAYSQEEHQRHIADGLIYWGKDGKGKVPAYKRYKHALRNADGVVPQTCGLMISRDTRTVRARNCGKCFTMSPSVSDFATPKPSLLIQRILQIATDKDSVSSIALPAQRTTAHAVSKQNAEDGGIRRFILVEIDPNIARNVTAERVRRVTEGYTNAKGQASRVSAAASSSAPFAEPLFDADGQIRPDVTFAQLAEFVWFVGNRQRGSRTPARSRRRDGETRFAAAGRLRGPRHLSPLQRHPQGSFGGRRQRADRAVYDILPKFAGPKVIYAAANRMGARAGREGITFKQTPYALDV